MNAKAQVEALKALGLEPIQTKDGIKFVTPEGFEATFDASKLDINGLWDKLTDEQKELASTDLPAFLRAIVPQIANQVHANRPPATADRAEEVISNEQIDAVWEKFVSQKRKDGNPAFPDSDKKDCQDKMNRVYNAPTSAMQALRQFGATSEAAQHLMLEYLWLKVNHAEQAKRILLADAKRKREAEQKRLQGEVSPSGSGSEVSPAAQSSTGGGSESDRLRHFVVTSADEEEPEEG